MEYTVDLDGWMPVSVQDADLDRFLTALERRVTAPAVAYDTGKSVLGARFIVTAPTARDAVGVATDAFCAALQEVGLPSSPAFTALHVIEEREEAATAV